MGLRPQHPHACQRIFPPHESPHPRPCPPGLCRNPCACRLRRQRLRRRTCPRQREAPGGHQHHRVRRPRGHDRRRRGPGHSHHRFAVPGPPLLRGHLARQARDVQGPAGGRQRRRIRCLHGRDGQGPQAFRGHGYQRRGHLADRRGGKRRRARGGRRRARRPRRPRPRHRRGSQRRRARRTCGPRPRRLQRARLVRPGIDAPALRGDRQAPGSTETGSRRNLHRQCRVTDGEPEGPGIQGRKAA